MAETPTKSKGGGSLVNKGIMAGLLGGVVWLAVMTGFDLYTAKPFTHTPKTMVILLGVTKDTLGIGLPYAFGVGGTLLLFIILGVVYGFLSSLLPVEVSVVLGFIFGGVVCYFVFFSFFHDLPANINRLSHDGIIVANLAVGVALGLKLHK